MVITITLDESEARLILYLLKRRADQTHYSYSTGRRKQGMVEQLLDSTLDKFEAIIPNEE